MVLSEDSVLLPNRKESSMKRIICLAWVLLSLGLYSCQDNTPLTIGSIEQTSWQLLKMPTKMLETSNFKIAFEAGTLYGKGPCNRYHATYYISEGEFNTSGGIGRTNFECPANGEIEKAFYDYLYNTKTIGYKGEQLVLRSSAGDMVFESIPFTTKLD